MIQVVEMFSIMFLDVFVIVLSFLPHQHPSFLVMSASLTYGVLAGPRLHSVKTSSNELRSSSSDPEKCQKRVKLKF